VRERRRLLLIPIVLLVLAALVALGVVRRLHSAEEEEPTRGVPVRVERPVRGPIEKTIRYAGHLVPETTVTVVPKIAGRIDRLLVEKGEAVRNDQPLALIEDESLMLRLDQAYSAWQAAEAQYEKASKGVRRQEIENLRALADKAREDARMAQENADRVGRLYEKGAVSKAGAEEAESALRAAQTVLENARRSLALMEEGASEEELAIARENARAIEAQYELVRLQADYTVVRSPAQGVVAETLQDPGNMVGQSVPLLVIVQDDPVVAHVACPERYYRELAALAADAAESRARIQPVAYQDEEPFLGVIRRLDPVVDAVSRTFTVEIEVENPQGRLRPGMYVTAEIRLEKVEDALLVPHSAVVMRDGGEVVFAALPKEKGDNGNPEGIAAAEMRPVITGLRNDVSVEILEGVALDDWIITDGNAFLEDGQDVEILMNP